MLELELATTEQIIDELAKRPADFAMVCVPKGCGSDESYIAFSPHLDHEAARSLLARALRALTDSGLDPTLEFDWREPGETGQGGLD